MISASASYISRQPWRHSGTMISPPCRFPREKTLRKGVLFFVFSLLIFVGGTILTVLGFSHVTESGGSMLGMLMVAISVLLFLGSLREYLKAKKIKAAGRTNEMPCGTVATSLVIESDETNRTLTVVMDTVNMNACYDRRSTTSSLPPDYTEATTGSDMYSECGFVIDADDTDRPPPYGPPTYDQVMSQDNSYLTQRECDRNSSQNGAASSRVRHSEQEGYTNRTVIAEDAESNQPVGYQDLPTVTI